MMAQHMFSTLVLLCTCGGQALLSQNVPMSRQIGSNRTWKIRTKISAPAPQATAPVDGRSRVMLDATAQQGGRRASDGGGRLIAAGLSLALSILLSSPASSLAADSGMPGSGPGCSTSTNPSYSLVSCERTGLDRDGRLLGCSASENCLSTSAVKVPGKLGSPWEYSRQTEDADRAFGSLVRAVEGTSEATMKTIDVNRRYLLAQFPSKVPPGSVDSVEFLVKPDDQIVLYRSVSRDTLFLYPLQQPVSDQGKIKERLEGIRKELGWSMYTYRGE